VVAPDVPGDSAVRTSVIVLVDPTGVDEAHHGEGLRTHLDALPSNWTYED
jgi:hypothetical protein